MASSFSPRISLISSPLTRTELKHWEMTKRKMKKRKRRKRGIETLSIEEREVQSMCIRRTLDHFYWQV